jgi:hypothetical protein
MEWSRESERVSSSKGMTPPSVAKSTKFERRERS